ncbi:MAG: hypothetical protein GTN69_06925 [Armatimonadetes bacterium]|nr:hypothetical protein [Armatimonadota bacterium]
MTLGLPFTDVLPVLRIDPWARTLRDNAGGTAPAVEAGLEWLKNGQVYSLKATGSGRLVAADTATLQAITDFTLFWWGDLYTPGLTRTVLDKRDAGGTQLKVGFDYSGGDRVLLYDGTNTRTRTVNLSGLRSACVTQESGSIGDVYLNGALSGPLSGASTITANDAAVTLLNAYDGSEPLLDRVSGLLLYAGTLSAEKIAALHAYALARSSPRTVASRLSWDRDNGVPVNDDGDTGSWDLGRITNGQIADRSGRDHHGTVVGGLTYARTSLGPGLYFQGDGNINVNVAASDISSTEGYVEVLFRVQDKVATQYVWSSNANIRDRLFVSGSAVQYQRGSPAVTIVKAIAVNQWLHVVGAYENGDMELFVNGESVGTDSFLDTSQATVASIGDFNNGGSLRVDSADVLYVRRGCCPITATEVKQRWLRAATTTVFYEDMGTALPTTADISGQGARIPGTDYVIETGTWKVVEDSQDRWVECVSAGVLCRTNPYTAGTWEFEWLKGTGSSQPYFSFAQDRAASDWQGLGYQVVVSASEGLFLRRTNAGSATTIASTANGFVEVGVRYKIRITSSLTDWRWWIKGGAYTSWTELTSGSDGTYTESMLAAYDFDAGDRIYMDTQYHGAVDPA